MEDREHHPETPEPPRSRHEERDVSILAITRFGIGLSLTIIAVIFILWGLFSYFKTREAALGPPPSRGVFVDARKLPPEPRLQTAPVTDLRDMRAAEDQILNHYAWIDPDKGIVRSPIARAMDLLAQKGLPYRPQTAEGGTAAGTAPQGQKP